MAGPIVGNKRRGFTFRMSAIEVAGSITPNDRQPLERRFDAAETSGGIAAAANWKLGLDTRLNALEAVVWP